MRDTASEAMIAEIRRRAEKKLGRSLTDREAEKIGIPRSYIGLESILDYLDDEGLDASAVEEYLNDL